MWFVYSFVVDMFWYFFCSGKWLIGIFLKNKVVFKILYVVFYYDWVLNCIIIFKLLVFISYWFFFWK